ACITPSSVMNSDTMSFLMGTVPVMDMNGGLHRGVERAWAGSTTLAKRGNFLQVAGQSTPHTPETRSMPKGKIGLAGSRFQADCIAASVKAMPEEAEVVAVASPTPGNAQAFARRHGIPAFSIDYRDML